MALGPRRHALSIAWADHYSAVIRARPLRPDDDGPLGEGCGG
jgi:hypothetical protein